MANANLIPTTSKTAPLGMPKRDDDDTSIGTKVGNLARGVAKMQGAQFDAMRQSDTKYIKAPLALAGTAVMGNVVDFGRAAVGAAPLNRDTAAPLGTPSRSPASAMPDLSRSAPASAGGLARPRPLVITPSDADSMSIVPANRGLLNRPGANSGPASHALGFFSGSDGKKRKITQADNTALSAALPTSSGPVVAGPNGGFAFATGGAPATAAGSAAAPAQPLTRPIVDDSRVNSRVNSADRERRDFIGTVQEQIEALGPINMRSKRALLGNLLQLQGGAVGQAGTLADAASGRNLTSQTQLTAAQMGEQGANERALAEQLGANYRAGIVKPELMVDAQGGVNQVSGALARPVVAEGGSQLRTVTAQQQKSALGPRDLVDFLGSRRDSLVERLQFAADPKQRALIEEAIDQVDARVDQLFDAGPTLNAPISEGAIAVHPDGRRMVLKGGEWVSLP